MKKLIYSLLATLMLALMSCGHKSGRQVPVHEDPPQQEVKTFTDKASVLEYHDWCINSHSVDTIFLSMPATVLGDVVSVLLKNKSTITVDDIVYEFLKNRNIYESIGSSRMTKDTLINGVKYEIRELTSLQTKRYESNCYYLHRNNCAG